MNDLRLGTRGSQLALWQANAVAARIAAIGGPPCRIVVIKTSGDRLQEAPLSEAGGKRLFVKEIEDALLRGEIDLAVHSSKDMPAALPESLVIAGTLPRDNPLDAVVLPVAAGGSGLMTIEDLVAVLGQTPGIGTSSVRRVAQLTRLFPNARFEPIRGNLDTRLRKLDEGQYNAIVLAAAGLRRLGFDGRISMALPAAVCVPAPGQGIVAIEIRADDDTVRYAVSQINDPQAAAALDAERAVVEALGGGCQTPIGALATPRPGKTSETSETSGSIEAMELDLVACVVSLDGSRAVRGHARGPMQQARQLGVEVARQLLSEGAAGILEQHRN
ncbi:MAG TPA: hydroxymethylbilane synthase [Vicinamibacterales bacterium]|nr:hydroxymethylbilane synthase [Vicinamibacterales bacterium]